VLHKDTGTQRLTRSGSGSGSGSGVKTTTPSEKRSFCQPIPREEGVEPPPNLNDDETAMNPLLHPDDRTIV
jgi:hypothetical protein